MVRHACDTRPEGAVAQHERLEVGWRPSSVPRVLTPRERGIPVVSFTYGCWQLGERSIVQRRHREVDAEDAIGEASDDPDMREVVDGVHEVRFPAEGVGAAGTDTDLEGEFGRPHGRRPSGGPDVSRHGSGEEYPGRPDQGRVDDLEVGVREREGRPVARRHGAEPQAPGELGSIVLVVMGAATPDLRVHAVLLRSGSAEDLGRPALPSAASTPLTDPGQHEPQRAAHHDAWSS
jgi:hypothetical protein